MGRRSASVAPWGTFISSTMMVMMMAITPSLNASKPAFVHALAEARCGETMGACLVFDEGDRDCVLLRAAGPSLVHDNHVVRIAVAVQVDCACAGAITYLDGNRRVRVDVDVSELLILDDDLLMWKQPVRLVELLGRALRERGDGEAGDELAGARSNGADLPREGDDCGLSLFMILWILLHEDRFA